jgi:hypothetical protein
MLTYADAEALGVLLAWLLVLVFRPRCSTRLQVC